MKNFFIALIVVLLLLLAGAYWFLRQTQSYLHSDSFIHQLEGYMSEVMAVPVEIEDIELVDLSSATMVGFKIPLYQATAAAPDSAAAAPAATPVLVDARRSTVVFAGIPKMEGDNTMKRLEINEPVVWLEQEEDGAIAWPLFQSRFDSPAELPGIELQEVVIKDAKVHITGRDGFTALVMEGVDITGAFTARQGFLTGGGELTAERVLLGGKVAITNFKSPVEMSREVMKLTQMSGELYGGTLTGQMTVTPKPKSQPMELSFNAKRVDSGAFLEAMGIGSALQIGQVEIDFQGWGELLEPLLIAGEADFFTSSFNSAGVPVIAQMQKTAQNLNLADVDFESLRGSLETNRGVVTFTRIESLPPDASRLTAQGTVNLEGDLNLEGTIELEGGAVGSVEKFFKDAGLMSEDGSLVKQRFKVTGTTDEPKIEM
ncbi:MAG: AsmA-like C-terminal region-containing protein [Verrucomicrobiota bacterium]